MACLRFENFTADTENFRLTRGEDAVPLEPIVFDLLVTFVECPGRVLSRDELIERVWHGRFVSDSTVSTAVKALRKALGDSGEAQRLIRTVRGRGFEFLGTVTSEGAAPPAPPVRGPATPEPAVYVRVLGDEGNASMHIQARALASRIRTVLGRIPLLRIVGQTASGDQLASHAAFCTELGVTLLVDIFLVDLGETVHIDAALIETGDGTQPWSRAFEAALGSLARENVLHDLIRHLEPAILRAMISGLTTQTEAEPRALLLRAAGLMSQKGWHAATFREAETLLERAVAADPDLALGHGYLALIRALGHRLGILRGDPAVVRRAIASADRALDLQSNDSMTLGLAGCALADAGEVARAVPILERAVEVNPENGHAKTALGAALVLLRRFAEAEDLLGDGIRISPADSRLAVWGTVHALARLAQGNIDGADAALRDAVKEDFQLYMPHVARVAVALKKADRDGAIAAGKDCLRTRPEIAEAEVIALVGHKAGKPVWDVLSSLAKTLATEGP